MKNKSRKAKRDIRDLLEDFIQLSEILIKAKTENLDFYTEIEAKKTWNEIAESVEEARQLLAEESKV